MKHTHIIRTIGTNSTSEPREIAVSLPAVPGIAVARDTRPETAPRRSVITPPDRTPAELFIAALRQARDVARKEALA